MGILSNYIEIITDMLQSGGIIFGILIVLLESFIPVLPLGVFVALNVGAYGSFIGILISWLATSLGCYLAFLLFRLLSIKYFNKHIKKQKLEKIISKIKSISFSNLVVLIALPFTPSFLINIACGVVNMSKKKFIAAILLGKIFSILFWGYIGKSLLESITDIKVIILVSILVAIAYFISKIISKKLEIE